MCDFAADAKAAEELMVGRTLTVARVRELNAKDYFYPRYCTISADPGNIDLSRPGLFNYVHTDTSK